MGAWALPLSFPTPPPSRGNLGWSSSARLRPSSGALIYFPYTLPSCCSITPLPHPQPSPLSAVLCRSLLSLQLAHELQHPQDCSAGSSWSQTSRKAGADSDSCRAGTITGPVPRWGSPLVVCPDQAGAVDSQDSVPDGEAAVGSRGAVLDQGADVNPRRAQRGVLQAGGEKRDTKIGGPQGLSSPQAG